MLTLSMIILHLAIPRKIGRQILTSFYQPTLLLAMGHAARSTGVTWPVQCLVDRLTQFYLGLATTINIHIWELRWELNDDVLSIPKQA